MMDISKQAQHSGDNSVNVQAEIITINTGLSIAHMKEIALDVFENNFYKLSGLAKETAEQRATEITDQFLKELSEKNPDGMKATEDPDFQHALFTAQKEFAKCGDKELGDILVDILVDRTKETARSLLQIVLNEALAVAPKLNSDQLDILACYFNIGHTHNNTVVNFDTFKKYLNDSILIFSDPINLSKSNYNHLIYVSCISIRLETIDILQTLINTYQAIFCKGYPQEAIKEIEDIEPNIVDAHIPCMHDRNLIQASGINDKVIKEICGMKGISEDSTNRLIQINQQHLMNHQEAKEFINTLCPKFSKFLEDAGATPFIHMELTSVGIAIAHAHSKKKAGFDADLSMWI